MFDDFFSGGNKLEPWLTGSKTANDTANTLGLSEGNILRSAGNPLVYEVNQNRNELENAEDIASMTQATDRATWEAAHPGQIYPYAFGSASDMMASVTRATYDDWRKTYLPIALEMMNQTTYNNPALVKKEVASAVGGVNSAFNSAKGVRERTASRYGVQFDDQQKASNERIMGLEKSTAVVDAANRIRQRLADRNRAIATSGIPNIAGKDYGQGS